jgi:hypothetical protein
MRRLFRCHHAGRLTSGPGTGLPRVQSHRAMRSRGGGRGARHGVVERRAGWRWAGVARGGGGGGDLRRQEPEASWSFLPLRFNDHRPPAMMVVCMTADVDGKGVAVGLIKGERWPLAVQHGRRGIRH